MKRFWPLVGAFLFALIVCSTAFAVMVGSRHQAEAMTDLGDPAWAIIQEDDGTTDDGTHVKFKEIADSADKVQHTPNFSQQITEIRLRVRLSGQAAGDDRLAVWVDGTAAANKVGSVLPPKGNTWATQTLSLSTPISSGSHTIYFGPNQANDAFIAFDWAEFHGTSTADTTPPTTTITSAGLGTTSDNTPTFSFSGSDNAGVTGFDCRVYLQGRTAPSFSSCTSPHTTAVLADGSYTFEVRARDSANNVDATPASDSFTVDATPSGTDTDGDGVQNYQDDCPNEAGPASNGGCPTSPPPDTTPPAAPTITEGPAEGSADTDGMVDFAWTGAEAGGSFECSLDSGTPSYEACVSPKHYMGYPDGRHTFRVRQVDDAGNVGAAARRSFIAQTDSGGTGGDTDTDGISDANDSCDMQWGPAANGGCPYPQSTDYDFDGIPNSQDDITGLENQNPSLAGNPRIKANCDVYAVNRFDPIARTQHLHEQFGNTTTTNNSTGNSLFNAGRGTTSCDMPWLTSAGWFPVVEGTQVSGVNVYYRARGDQRYVQALPKGLQLLANNQSFQCGGNGNFQNTPVYGCNDRWGFRIDFPDCVDLRIPHNETANAVESRNGQCPQSHPYRIPQVNFLVMHANGVIPNPLRVSMGVDQWGTYQDIHADYFAAVQPEFNQDTSFGTALIEMCLRDGQGSASGPARCGTGN